MFAFPVFIALLVPIRFWMKRVFDEEHLVHLDTEEEAKDEENHWS